MPLFKMAISFIRIEHLCYSTRDPVVELYLKQICRKNNWKYSYCSFDKFSFCKSNDHNVMVMDLFAHPLFYPSIVEGLKCSEVGANSSFLFILPRTSLTAFVPSFFFQSEYCFLGFDGVDEILQRIRMILSKKNFASDLSLPYSEKNEKLTF